MLRHPLHSETSHFPRNISDFLDQQAPEAFATIDRVNKQVLIAVLASVSYLLTTMCPILSTTPFTLLWTGRSFATTREFIAKDWGRLTIQVQCLFFSPCRLLGKEVGYTDQYNLSAHVMPRDSAPVAALMSSLLAGSTSTQLFISSPVASLVPHFWALNP